MQLEQEQTERTESGANVACVSGRLSAPHYSVTPPPGPRPRIAPLPACVSSVPPVSHRMVPPESAPSYRVKRSDGTRLGESKPGTLFCPSRSSLRRRHEGVKYSCQN